MEYEVRVPLEQGTEVFAYCFSCACLLFSAQRAGSIELFMADNAAREHWGSYEKDHDVAVTDLTNGDIRLVNEAGQFYRIGDSD